MLDRISNKFDTIALDLMPRIVVLLPQVKIGLLLLALLVAAIFFVRR